MSPDHGTQAVCPRYHRAVELIGRRWSGAIVRVLLDGPRRFTEILEQVDGLTDRLLSERLKELEAEGVVARRVYPETPVRIEYALTEKGRDLERVVREIHRWADRWIPAPSPARRRSPRGDPGDGVDSNAAIPVGCPRTVGFARRGVAGDIRPMVGPPARSPV